MFLLDINLALEELQFSIREQRHCKRSSLKSSESNILYIVILVDYLTDTILVISSLVLLS